MKKTGLTGFPVFAGVTIGRAVAANSATGPIVMGGLRFAGDSVSAGAEIRYQAAEGEVGDDFAAPKIDLGGWSYLFTVGLRFGR